MKNLFIVLIVIFSLQLISKVTIIKEDADKILFEYTQDKYEVNDSDEFIEIISNELNNSTHSGAPMIPSLTKQIILPQNGNIQIEIVSYNKTTIKLTKPIKPFPFYEKRTDSFKYKIDNKLYADSQQQIAQINSKNRYRTLETASIKISPFAYNYSKNELSVYDNIKISVSLFGDKTKRANIHDAYQSLYKQTFLNYETGKYWRGKIRADIEYADFSMFPQWFKFSINKDGIYKLMFDDLKDISSLNLSDIDPATIRIFSTGGKMMNTFANNYGDGGYKFQEIPLYFNETIANSSFDEHEYFLFYAQDRDGYNMNEPLESAKFPIHYYNPYSGDTVYWLTFGEDNLNPPKRIETISHSSSGNIRTNHRQKLHFEQESIRRTDGGFSWYWNLLSGFGDTSFQYNFTIKNLDQNQDTKIGFSIREIDEYYSNGYCNVKVNSTQLNSQTISYTGQGQQYFDYTNATFQEGSNKFEVEIVNSANFTKYFDFYFVEYYQKLIKDEEAFVLNIDNNDIYKDISYTFESSQNDVLVFEVNRFNEVNLVSVNPTSTGFNFIGNGISYTKYWVVDDNDYQSMPLINSYNPKDLVAELNQNPETNLIIISPDKFLSQAEELANIHEEFSNVKALVVDQQDIFDQFNGGMPDPNAIRTFFKQVLFSLGEEHFEYGILLGSGISDWRNFSASTSEKGNIIVYQKFSDKSNENLYSIASDDYFAFLNNNSKPEFALGRYPAQTPEQLSIMIENVRNYLSNHKPGLWNNTILISADDQYHSGRVNDTAHTREAEANAITLNKSINIDKLYSIEYELDAFHKKPEVREKLINKLNEGRLAWIYTGHAAYDILGDEGYFANSDISLLNNRDHLPFFISASCSNGLFDNYHFDSMGELLLYNQNGGAIATFTASRPTYGSPNKDLVNRIYKYTFNQRNLLGKAILLSKNDFPANDSTTNSQKYILLGDPLLPVFPPKSFQNVEFTTTQDTLQALQQVKISGSFESDNSTVKNGTAITYIYDSEKLHTETWPTSTGTLSIDYLKKGNYLFRGKAKVVNDDYHSEFIVPYDIIGGNSAKIVTHFFDANTGKDFLDYKSSINITGHGISVPNEASPEIKLFFNEPTNSSGENLDSSPLIIAKISDLNGINITSTAGHKMLLYIEDETDFIDITESFIYDENSYSSGELSWQLENISKGKHTLQLIVFDNQNESSICNSKFEVTSSDGGVGDIVINNLLPYPNPYKGKEDFYFTFNIDMIEDPSVDVSIKIYTITGKKIQSFKTKSLLKGYNQIRWNLRDKDGDKIANNTYIYKIKAKRTDNGEITEKIGKLIIYR